MIVPRERQDAIDVAGHYDELDTVYREVWGLHVHHGYWRTGRESPADAANALSDLVAGELGIQPGQHLCDIGCGYGATAARLAANHGVRVTGLTVSGEQAAHAVASKSTTILHRDWLDNRLPDAAFDAAYAIESSEHMVDKQRFFNEARRVLKPGGRLVVCAWLARDHLRRWELDHLIEPICREGRLPSMGTRGDYEAMAAEAGFAAVDYRDISRQVRRTWTICARRFVGKLLSDGRYRRLVTDRSSRNRMFALSVPRLILAYRTGAMRYGLFTFAALDPAASAPQTAPR